MTYINIVKGTSKKKTSTEKIKQWVLTEEGLDKYQEMTQSDIGWKETLIILYDLKPNYIEIKVKFFFYYSIR